MANPTVSVNMQTQSAIVARNSSYQLNFTITEPTQLITQVTPMSDGGSLGVGHLFSLSIDKTKWKSITSLVVN